MTRLPSRLRLCTWLALFTLLALTGCQGLPAAQDCASVTNWQADQLHGQWRAQVEGEPTGSLVLGPHPEHAGSLRGTLSQGAQRHAVAADLEKGEFTMEESHDGQRISATWLGQLSATTCGRQIEGQKEQPGQASRRFQLSRLP